MQKGKDIPLRIYADGVFDSFHIGHSNMFKQCRELFPDQNIWVIGGVCNQQAVQEFKGPTISSQQERIQMVRQCKWIDEVIPKAPWVITQEFLNEQNIDFVCHDQLPYTTKDTSGDYDDAYAVCKKLGKFKATQRTQGVSTTDVVAKILKNKQMYYFRNMKRGDTRSKLGMSQIRYLYYQLKLKLCPAVNQPKKST